MLVLLQVGMEVVFTPAVWFSGSRSRDKHDTLFHLSSGSWSSSHWLFKDNTRGENLKLRRLKVNLLISLAIVILHHHKWLYRDNNDHRHHHNNPHFQQNTYLGLFILLVVFKPNNCVQLTLIKPGAIWISTSFSDFSLSNILRNNKNPSLSYQACVKIQ